LNALLNYAVQKRLLKENPANFANRELIGNIKSKKPQLNLDEVRMAVSVLTDKRVLKRERVWVLFGIMTGGRMDEVNRAQWPDVDWTAHGNTNPRHKNRFL
jgi:integrase